MQESAARGRVGSVVAEVLVPAADLSVLTVGFRDDDSYDVLKLRPDVRDAACTIADFVDLTEFIPDRPSAQPVQDSEALYVDDDDAEIEALAEDPKGKAGEETISQAGDAAGTSKAAE